MVVKILLIGSIGAGKTTLMDRFKLCGKIKLVYEPIRMWTNFEVEKGRHINCLEMLYSKAMEPFTFQAMTLSSYGTQYNRLVNNYPTDRKAILFDRHAFSSVQIFSKQALKENRIKDYQHKLLTTLCSQLTPNQLLKMDYIFYLHTMPNVCLQRVKERGRKEEIENITLEYLQGLYNNYEEWFGSSFPPFEVPAGQIYKIDSTTERDYVYNKIIEIVESVE